MNWGRSAAVIFLLMVVLLAFLYAFSMIRTTIQVPPGTAEIRQYNGQPLSSIGDFRENSIKGPQYINISTYTLTVDGLVNNTRNYSYADVLAYPHESRVATLHCVEGWSVTILWGGVPLRDILADAGPEPGAKTVILYAADGYSTAVPLDYIENSDIMLAYKMNNVTLPPERGYPFQLVAEGKWGYKWIKWVTRIELSDKDYEGYWEQRGYSNSGDLNASYVG